MIFHTTTRTAAVTAAIMIFMQAIVSVNTTQNVAIQPETDISTARTTTTQFDLNKNLIIVQQQQQQQLYQSTKTKSQQTPLQTSMPPTLLSLNPFHLSHTKTETMAQPSPTLPKLRMTRSAATASMAMRSTSDSGSGSSDGVSGSECKSLSPWGDVDPNIFYICDTQTKKPLQLRCPEGRSFFLGLGFSGCIPYEQWPACIPNGHHEQVELCDSEHMQQPWETVNPNKFYVCLRESIEPAILNCEPGKGFVHAIVTVSGSSANGKLDGGSSEIVGCANFEKWRSYMQCNDYY